jgi:hypothetical protein
VVGKVIIDSLRLFYYLYLPTSKLEFRTPISTVAEESLRQQLASLQTEMAKLKLQQQNSTTPDPQLVRICP